MSIEDSIKHELSGDFERLMLAVGKKQLSNRCGTTNIITRMFISIFLTVQCIRSVPMFFAKRLYKSMKVRMLVHKY